MSERPLLLPLEERMTEAEVAAYLQVGRGTLKNWRSAMTGPAYYKFGRAIVYRRRDVEVFVASRRVEPAQSFSVTLGYGDPADEPLESQIVSSPRQTR